MSLLHRLRSSRRLLVTLGVLGGSFLAAMEATIVATAMPTVVDQFGGLAHYSWVFSGYMLTSTVTTPVWGRLADVHGRRRPYLLALGLFIVGSMLCGAATSMTQLIAYRALQGIGAGGMLPLGMVIMGDMFTLEERARAQGLFAAVWGVSSVAGPLVGAVLTESASWRWIFFMNLPFGLVAAWLVGTYLVDRHAERKGDVDYVGAALLMAAVSALMLALNQTGVRDATLSPGVVRALYAGAVLLGVVFVARERRTEHPLLPVSLLGQRMVATTTLTGTLLGIGIFGALAFVPLYVQAALGRSAREAGSVLTPLLLGWVLTSIVTGRLIPRFGFRPFIIGGLSFVTVGFVGLAMVGLDSPMWKMRVDLGLMGIGMGMTMLSLLLAVQGTVAREQLGVATSLGQFTRSIGGAIGVAVMGAVVAAAVPVGGQTPVALALGLHRAFVLGAGVSAVALLSALLVPGGLPEQKPTAV
ncbi:MFS transporter [Luteitalea sp. TBR-22]|uniref:MDR family MFS transporter n=1 Tax=Luteitalea sp. TBR-22 TaxID=2802971 RepID=UPI001AF68AC4|nr:MDR family MFS transporter [Luteitalea sp. TBR-22]BCS32830.1 MFS transporter [Luteitalea sp. TBR-22]